MGKAYIIDFKKFTDDRGTLIPFELNNNCPFDIKRIFLIYGTDKAGIERANHINETTNQILIAVSGKVDVDVKYGNQKETFVLNAIDKGLYLECGTYKKLYNFSPDCIILCICDNYYRLAKYK